MSIYSLYKYFPDWLIVIILKIFIFFKKNEKFKFSAHKTDSKRNLIYLDIQGAIGDFTIYIRNLICENNNGSEFDVIVGEKFKGILEKLKLKNITIFYKKELKIKHYDLSMKTTIYDILEEAKLLKREYDKVYYLSPVLFIEQVIFLSQINYNKLVKMKDIYKHSYKKTFWIDKRYLFESLYTYSKKRQLHIKSIGNSSLKNLHFVDYAYYIMHNKLPEKSLLSINIWDDFKTKVELNTVAVLLDYSKRTKFLNGDKLIDILNSKYENYNVVFLGINVELNSFTKDRKLKFNVINRISKCDCVLDLFNEISRVQEVLAFDTCILHIAAILNKKIFLIMNEIESVCLYKFDAWDNYSLLKNFSYVKLPKENFSDIENS